MVNFRRRRCPTTIRSATGLAPQRRPYVCGLPRLSVLRFDRAVVDGHHGLSFDTLAYSNLATDRQQRPHDIVHEHHGFAFSRVAPPKLRPHVRLAPAPEASRGQVGNTAGTTCQGVKAGTDDKALKDKRFARLDGPLQDSRCWPLLFRRHTGRFSSLFRLLCSYLHSNMLGGCTHHRVSVGRCKPCANLRDRGDMSKYLLAG